MEKHRLLTVVRLLALAAIFFLFGTNQGRAQTETAVQPSHDSNSVIERMMNRTTQADRQAAAENQAAARAAAAKSKLSKQSSKLAKKGAQGGSLAVQGGQMNVFAPMSPLAPMAPLPGGTPDYFGVANWANSPHLRKFVDSLPGLGADANNNLGQYIPIAVADVNAYPGSDYYKICLVQYTEKMHSDLPPTRLRGYVQLETAANAGISKHIALTYPNGNPILDANGVQVLAVDKPHYLGPIIIAQKNRPTRVKFTNYLATGTDGDLFIPVDTTTMGAGMGPIQMLDANGIPMLNPDGTPMMEMYKQNRAVIHLHGGATPWISDGTPHQWITPAGENTVYPKGVSVQNVPDMPDPGPGSMTFFYTNQQSARLMFYHDHSYGITRLNVYAGEAAGYLVQDPNEQGLVNTGVIPSTQIPLIIQDKTFVDVNTTGVTDPTWNWGSMPPKAMTGDLWFPHVYMPNQNPFDNSGANPFGRWDYGPWFWPPLTTAAGLKHGEVTNPYYDPINAPWEPPLIPGTPKVSMVMEAFMDTPIVNGTPYPYLKVNRKAYRFRILNACNDRFLNLQLYFAASNAPMWNSSGALNDANAGEVNMVPAIRGIPGTTGYPVDITDGRDGGVPDVRKAGPKVIQIGTEGSFLPAPVVLSNSPIGYNYNRRDIVVLNVSTHSLFLGPAERADVIIDFSQVPDGSKLILYNDSPAPVPGFDPRLDYYTGDPCQTTTGGAPSTLPGYGPNTRTILQFQVAVGGSVATAFDVNALNTALPKAFAASQDKIIVPQAAYGPVYGKTFTDKYVRIQDTNITFTPIGSNTPMTINLKPKAIQELFELDYGRMNSTLGVELPFTNFLTQTTIPLGFIDPPTEDINDSVTPMAPAAGDGTQIWKITHNGVDTHAIHFHLFNVQVINRVGWDGAIRPPEKNELGWKETVKMNPLEDCIVAMRAVAPKLPFGIPDSNRPLDPTKALNDPNGFTNVDPATGNPITVINKMFNFGWEYVWHCHLLGHEEMDMMRPIVFNVARTLPTAPVLSGVLAGAQVNLTWTDATPANAPTTLGNPANEIGFALSVQPLRTMLLELMPL
jgi:FtsP/CotA-like multicopper oxidase with cupredoxin domain